MQVYIENAQGVRGFLKFPPYFVLHSLRRAAGKVSRLGYQVKLTPLKRRPHHVTPHCFSGVTRDFALLGIDFNKAVSLASA
jgi:hypothetical protein